jgi:hypothetical protein
MDALNLKSSLIIWALEIKEQHKEPWRKQMW